MQRIMYFPYFIAYIVIGFAIALPFFWWAIRNGQFKDQQRARYLPLEKEDARRTGRVSRLNRLEGYVLILLAIGGIMSSVSIVIFALIHGGK